jgi:hypothetical protein
MQGMRVERLDHLGIVAGVCREVTVQADPECSIGMRMTAEGQLLLECR